MSIEAFEKQVLQKLMGTVPSVLRPMEGIIRSQRWNEVPLRMSCGDEAMVDSTGRDIVTDLNVLCPRLAKCKVKQRRSASISPDYSHERTLQNTKLCSIRLCLRRCVKNVILSLIYPVKIPSSR